MRQKVVQQQEGAQFLAELLGVFVLKVVEPVFGRFQEVHEAGLLVLWSGKSLGVLLNLAQKVHLSFVQLDLELMNDFGGRHVLHLGRAEVLLEAGQDFFRVLCAWLLLVCCIGDELVQALAV